MSNKPCPYCGDEPDSTGAIVWCATSGCPNQGRQMYKCKWNRRFVCLDKNGDKVFSDSKFRYGGGPPMVMVWRPLAWHIVGEGTNTGNARRIHGFMLNNIELIKE